MVIRWREILSNLSGPKRAQAETRTMTPDELRAFDAAFEKLNEAFTALDAAFRAMGKK